MSPRVAEMSPLFLFYAAAAVSSWFGGAGPGYLATLLGSCTAAYFLLEPIGSFRVTQTEQFGRLCLFTATGMLVSWLNGLLHAARSQCLAESKAARAGEARARRLAESNLIPVFFSNRAGRIQWGNDAFLRLFGCRLGDLKAGMANWVMATVPEHRTLDGRAFAQLAERRTCDPYEKDIVTQDGRRVPVLMGCALLDTAGDQCVGFLLDLTDRRNAEAMIEAHQRRLHAELLHAEERERRRIASVLHDSVGSALALVRRKLESLQPDLPEYARELDEARHLLGEAIGHTRSLTSEISPPVLYELGLVPALKWLADRFEGEHGLICEVDVEHPRPEVAGETRLVLFQAVRELLSNAVRHGRASSCVIRVRREAGSIRLTVEDDGLGFDPSHAPYVEGRSGGFGLFIIRERMAYLGGTMAAHSEPDGGTDVTLVAPLAEVCPPADAITMRTDREHQDLIGR